MEKKIRAEMMMSGRMANAVNLPVPSTSPTEDIVEANVLIGFGRSINTALDIDRLFSTAARCLYEYLHCSMIIFQPAAEHAGSETRAVTSVCQQSCRDELVKLSQVFKGLSLDEIDDYAVLGLDCSNSGGIIDSCIYLDLPADMGHITLFWGEESHSNPSDAFLANVAEIFAVALNNAREFGKLKELSMRDALTGLFNRRVLEEMLVIESERREPAQLSMVLIDLDDFKKINDTYGHQTGDLVLSSFGAFLRKNCRGADLAVRYGGEEFAVLVNAHAVSDASEFAQRLMRNLDETVFMALGNHIRLTVSIGIAHSHGRVRFDLHELLKQADLALYRAKSKGKNQACIADNNPVYPVKCIKSRPKVRSYPAIVMAA